MKIKGTAVKSIIDFVKAKYPGELNNWLESLPKESAHIMKAPIYATSWYSMKEAAIIPTKRIAEMFFNDFRKGAWESGRFSAEIGLKGIYKIFIKATTPFYIIKRATKIFATYYSPSEMKVLETNGKSVKLHITKFDIPDKIIEYRIGGWIEKALELSGCKNVNIRITKSLTTGAEVTEYSINWN